MNYSTAIFLISDQVRAMMVTYESHDTASREMFKTLDPNIKIDDYVVVPTDTRHEMTVCKVVEADIEVDFDCSTPVGWIVGTVSTADFDEITGQEDDAVSKIKSAEKNRKKAELKKSLLADTGDALKALPIYSDDAADSVEG